MGNEASPGIRKIVRVFMELLMWAPVWLILAVGDGFAGKLLMICAAAVFFVLGLFLYKLPPVWSRVTLISVLAVLLAVGIIRFRGDLPAFLWMGVLLWRGRYPRLMARHYGFAFLICCFAVIVAAENEISSNYRILFTALALIWVVSWFISINRGLLSEAGLHNRIVTRPVRLATRKYLLIFLACALFVFALTVNYGKQLLTPPEFSVPEQLGLDVGEQPPAPLLPIPEEMMVPADDQGRPSVIWDILFWILTGLAALGALWFARMLWKDRTWTWRGILEAIRSWFVKEKKAEALPYVEERRSLLKEKKKGKSRWNALFHRAGREREWNQLDNSQKVRRLYEEAILSGIEQGYEFRPHHTPSETLERIEKWRVKKPVSDNDKHSPYWVKLSQIRLALLLLYEKAKYSPHSITDQEVKGLTGDASNDVVRKNR